MERRRWEGGDGKDEVVDEEAEQDENDGVKDE